MGNLEDPKIFNLSSRDLSVNEVKLLMKGLKFTPTPKPNEIEVKSDIKSFTRKLRLAEFFEPDENEESDSDEESDSVGETQPLVRNKSDFVPPRGRDKHLDKFCDFVEDININVKQARSNLTKGESKALYDLRNDKNIVIKEADKGGAIVIMDKEFYKEKLLSVLNNEIYYKKCNSREENVILNRISKLLDRYSDDITDTERDYLTNFDAKTAYFYGLPKIHKSKSIQDKISKDLPTVINIQNPEDLSFRPIVGGPESHTQRLSNFIDIILKPLCTHVPSYIRDDIDFLCKLPETVPEGSKLVSFDVVNLYSNIDTELGLKAIRYWLTKHRQQIPDRFSNEFIIDALQLVIENNVFYFDGCFYSQNKGVAMGTKVAPTYATLVLGYLEKLFYSKVEEKFGTSMKDYIVNSWKRFLDDCFLIIKNENDIIQAIHEILNSLDPSVTFTMECDDHTLNFLDVTVKIEAGGKIDTDIFYKKTDSHQYLNFGSCHPHHTKRNIPYCLARRVCTIVSNDEVKLSRLDDLKCFLLRQNYPESLIYDGIKKALKMDQQKLTSKVDNDNDSNNNIALVSTFNPNHENALSIVKPYFPLLSNSQKMEKILSKSNFINSRRQPKNLRKILTTSRFDSADVVPKVSKCGDSRCLTCTNIIEGSAIDITPSDKFVVRQNMNCDSKYVIYVIICSGCNEKYIGKTDQKLKRRMNLHRSQINQPRNRNMPVSEHLDTCGNGTFRVFPIYKLNYNNDKDLLLKESYFIRKYSPKLNGKT